MRTASLINSLVLAVANIVAAGLAMGDGLIQAEHVFPEIKVSADGSISLRQQLAAGGEASNVRYNFGMPACTPVNREMEDKALPACRTVWEQNGIRYTQIVLVTQFDSEHLAPDGKSRVALVVMVQVSGENVATEYTDATAGFSAQIAAAGVELELRDLLVYRAGPAGEMLLAAVDLPSGTVVKTSSSSLMFHGHMPPGTSGSLSFKIPLAKLASPGEIDRLRDLDFDEEFRRARKQQQELMQKGGSRQLLLGFGDL
jgi:hypothetical protein